MVTFHSYVSLPEGNQWIDFNITVPRFVSWPFWGAHVLRKFFSLSLHTSMPVSVSWIPIYSEKAMGNPWEIDVGPKKNSYMNWMLILPLNTHTHICLLLLIYIYIHNYIYIYMCRYWSIPKCDQMGTWDDGGPDVVLTAKVRAGNEVSWCFNVMLTTSIKHHQTNKQQRGKKTSTRTSGKIQIWSKKTSENMRNNIIESTNSMAVPFPCSWCTCWLVVVDRSSGAIACQLNQLGMQRYAPNLLDSSCFLYVSSPTHSLTHLLTHSLSLFLSFSLSLTVQSRFWLQNLQVLRWAIDNLPFFRP